MTIERRSAPFLLAFVSACTALACGDDAASWGYSQGGQTGSAGSSGTGGKKASGGAGGVSNGTGGAPFGTGGTSFGTGGAAVGTGGAAGQSASGGTQVQTGGVTSMSGSSGQSATGGTSTNQGGAASGGNNGKGGSTSGGVTGKGGSTSGGSNGKGGSSSGGANGKGGSSSGGLASTGGSSLGGSGGVSAGGGAGGTASGGAAGMGGAGSGLCPYPAVGMHDPWCFLDATGFSHWNYIDTSAAFAPMSHWVQAGNDGYAHLVLPFTTTNQETQFAVGLSTTEPLDLSGRVIKAKVRRTAGTGPGTVRLFATSLGWKFANAAASNLSDIPSTSWTELSFVLDPAAVAGEFDPNAIIRLGLYLQSGSVAAGLTTNEIEIDSVWIE